MVIKFVEKLIEGKMSLHELKINNCYGMYYISYKEFCRILISKKEFLIKKVHKNALNIGVNSL